MEAQGESYFKPLMDLQTQDTLALDNSTVLGGDFECFAESSRPPIISRLAQS